jgi:alkylhydroperoxidase/carboxymuconolactone decarboxylase family protein YurZ
MREKLPGHPSRFRDAHPEIYEAFEELGRLVHENGSLTERERRLVKLGVAIGVGTEGAVHSAVRHALAGGCSEDDVGHAVRLAITTIGWPRAMAALSWTRDAAAQPGEDGEAGGGKRAGRGKPRSAAQGRGTRARR